jgi:hypothetical protein
MLCGTYCMAFTVSCTLYGVQCMLSREIFEVVEKSSRGPGQEPDLRWEVGSLRSVHWMVTRE